MTKPVLVLQNQSSDGPGYLGQWMAANGVPFVVFNAEAGEDFPASIEPYSALALLGGEMSANDPLPFLRDAERLILDATARDRPVIGHCLGGQLMAKALGGRVTRAAIPEVGWHPVKLSAEPLARHWLGEPASVMVFQWHEDTFELPPDAVLLASSDVCRGQAFAVGRHLALQFHAEINAQKVAVWLASPDPSYKALQPVQATVHDPERISRDTAVHLAAHQQWVAGIYRRWLGR